MNIRRSVVRLAAAVACAVLVSPSAAGAKRRAGAIIYSIAEDEPGKPAIAGRNDKIAHRHTALDVRLREP